MGPLRMAIQAHGFRVMQQAPLVSMRIAAIDGRRVTQMGDSGGTRQHGEWALRREYRSTFRDSLTQGEQIVAGRWFGAGSARRDAADTAATGEIGEVSLEQGLANELHVRLNDVITWDVQGVQVPTRVTSLRDVTWTRFEPNFFAVFEPRVLRRAPKQYVMLADIPGAIAVATLQRDVVRQFPNVTSVDLSLVMGTIDGIIAKVSLAVQYLVGFTVIMGIPVLISAVAASRRERLREGILLRTLGASRAQIVQILLTEYAMLGLLGSGTGLVLALGGAWAIVHFVFGMPYFPAPEPAIAIAGTMTVLTVAIGLLAGRDVFQGTPMNALRSEIE